MSSRDDSLARASEQTPLLSRTDSPTEHEANGHADTSSLTDTPTTKKKTRWPVIAAIGLLSAFMILALIFGFATPSAIESYVREAVQFEADNLSVESFTNTGIRVRIQGTVWLDASKVHNKPTRDFGRFATYIAKEIDSGETDIQVYLPRYQDAYLGQAIIPPVKLNIRNRHYNWIDKVIDLEPGDPESIRKLTDDFMHKKLDTLAVRAVVNAPITSGLISLKQTVTQVLILEPSRAGIEVPKPELKSLKVEEWNGGDGPGHPSGLKAWAKLNVQNSYPIGLEVPPMTFDILLPGCDDRYNLVATTTNDKVRIMPRKNVTVKATALMTKLPTSLTTACPGSNKSPLDTFIARYLKGQDATVYVQGGDQTPETPDWIGSILRETIVPIPLPARPFDDMIKNFSLTNVHFSLPEDPHGQPVLSATVGVLVALPKDMNLDIDVRRVRADGVVFYEGEELGKLDLRKWQDASSRKVDGNLLVKSEVVNAPLEITNEDVFVRVIQRMIFQHQGVSLSISAIVDVDATTALGTFVVSGIPGKGTIFVKPPKTGGFKHKVGEISVVDSTPQRLTMKAEVSIQNPTEYSADMPRVDAELFVNGTRTGHAWGGGHIKPGWNNITSFVVWEKGDVGAEFLSQYISGYNVSLTIVPDKLPGLPKVPMNVTLAVPHIFGKFLKDTTIHILTQTATFVLFAPVAMMVTSVHSRANYNGSEIGTIDWEYPFKVEPGDNLTPRMPLDWNTPGSGLIRDALGGRLKIDAFADIGVEIGVWREAIWYESRGTSLLSVLHGLSPYLSTLHFS